MFVDSRVDIFERNGVFLDYLNAQKLRGSLAILDKYSIRYVLFERKAALSYLLEHTPGWKIDYQDPTTILFERIGPLKTAGKAPDGLKNVQPVNQQTTVRRASLRLPVHQ